jgi:hypothetical protein
MAPSRVDLLSNPLDRGIDRIVNFEQPEFPNDRRFGPDRRRDRVLALHKIRPSLHGFGLLDAFSAQYPLRREADPRSHIGTIVLYVISAL